MSVVSYKQWLQSEPVYDLLSTLCTDSVDRQVVNLTHNAAK